MLPDEVPADDWGRVTESDRCRRWRDGSAWARGARCCRRWRSATDWRGGRRRGGSSTSCARRRAGIASMRCGRLRDSASRWGRGTAVGASGSTCDDPRMRVMALWEASDRVCGKRLKVMIPTLLPALERHDRLKLGKADRSLSSRHQRRDDRPPAGRYEDRGGGRHGAVGPASTRLSGARCRSGRSTTGTTRRPASARSTWWRTAARRWPARSSRH